MRLVLLRHGESTWNKENRFTGWTDVDLSERGILEAQSAGDVLLREGYDFDCAFTSVLKRAIRTLWITLERMDRMWLPVTLSWKLNERHYGSLQALNKSEMAAKFGEDQVHTWRRSYDVRPPALERSDERFPGRDAMYRDVAPDVLPEAESLKDTVARVIPYYEDVIAPVIASGKRVLIAAHGNSMRALVKHLDGVSDSDIALLNIPTGIPLVYELDGMRAKKHYYLADEAVLAKALTDVAAQGAAKR